MLTIQIDPTLRTPRGTFTDFASVSGDRFPRQGEVVEARTEEFYLPARVEHLDPVSRIICLSIDWDALED